MSRNEPEHSAAQWERWIQGSLLLWFAARVVYLAFETSALVPPDETTHMGRILAFREQLALPRSAPGNFELGLLDRNPWLYYWGMARLPVLSAVPIPDLVLMRLANGALALTTLCIAIRWFRSWCSAAEARVLFSVLMTNTLMFTALSASVSYDNAANLFAATALLALARLGARPNARAMWLLAAALAAGCLTKRTLLPFALIVAGFALARARVAPRALFEDARSRLRSGSGVAAGLALLVLTFSVAELYGGNLVRYGRVVPEFDQVVGIENAMENRIFARNRVVRDLRSDRISLEEAGRLVQKLRDPVDRAATLYLMRVGRSSEAQLRSFPAYLAHWSREMLATSVGYLGHRRAMKGDAALALYAIVFAAATGLLVLRARASEADAPAKRIVAESALLVVGYALVLILFVNYPSYQRTHAIDLALQGRYLFPVLVPLYGLLAWSLGTLSPPRARPWIVGAVAALYLAGDLPWLLWQRPGLLDG